MSVESRLGSDDSDARQRAYAVDVDSLANQVNRKHDADSKASDEGAHLAEQAD